MMAIGLILVGFCFLVVNLFDFKRRGLAIIGLINACGIGLIAASIAVMIWRIFP